MLNVQKRTIVFGTIEFEFCLSAECHVDVSKMSSAEKLDFIDQYLDHEYGINWPEDKRKVTEVIHQVRKTMPLIFYKLHFITSDFFLDATGNDACYKDLCSVLKLNKFDFVVSEWEKHFDSIPADLIDAVEYQASAFTTLFNEFEQKLTNDSIYKDADEESLYTKWQDCDYEYVGQ